MAKHGRFFPPEQAQKTPIGDAEYALHIDAKLAADYLCKHAEKRGVTRTEGKVNEVVCDKRGFVQKLTLHDGREIQGDFFIDCTGFRALLIEKTLGVGYHDWSNYLPCDRVITVSTEAPDKTAPYTRAIARDAGWTWQIPLQHRTCKGYVYSSKFAVTVCCAKVLMIYSRVPVGNRSLKVWESAPKTIAPASTIWTLMRCKLPWRNLLPQLIRLCRSCRRMMNFCESII